MRKLLLDLPASYPALGFDRIARAMTEIIQESNPQLAIGIFGGWGSGKTTLMQAIEKGLDVDRSIAVRFSAWRYEREEHLIVPLLDTIREALLAATPAESDFHSQAKKTAGTIGRVIRSILAGVSVKAGVPGAIDISFDANKALAGTGDLKGHAEVSGSFYHASFRALESAFADLVGEASDPRVRIVVFVDDLDRCLPESALQVLESMKLFFDLPGFVFVVGLDQEVVQHVIDSKYGAETSGLRSRVSGPEYIKKIFQVPYRIAPVGRTEIETFLKATFLEADLSVEQRDELSERVLPHLRWLVGDAAVNPREIKRYINDFTLQTEIGGAVPLEPETILAVHTLASRGSWQALNNALLIYDDLLIDALMRFLVQDRTALIDLDPDLQNIPDDFLEYISPGEPGASLLAVDSVRPYLASGEALRSTQDPRLLDGIRIAGRIRRWVIQVANDQRPAAEVAQEILDAIPRLRDSLEVAPAGPLRDVLGGNITELNDLLAPYQRAAPAISSDPQAEKALFSGQVSSLATELVRRVLHLYRQGDIGESSAA